MIRNGKNSCNYLKFMLIGGFSTLLLTGYAQENEKQHKEENTHASQQGVPGQATVMDSIDIVRDYRPMLADAVKARRSPDMRIIDRDSLAIELGQIAAGTYFQRHHLRPAYHSPLPQKYPDALRDNIDNNRIGILAYRAGEYPRATTILEKVTPVDAFYQSSLIALGHIALETGDKQAAQQRFLKASQLDFDPDLKADAVYNYAKISFELGAKQEATEALQGYIGKKYATPTSGIKKIKDLETLIIEVLYGTSNFEAGVYMLEALDKKTPEIDRVYQQVTFYRGLEFYNERAFENSISMFMRSEKYPFDKKMAALATYWKAEAMYEVRKYGEAVTNFSRFLDLPAARSSAEYPYANYGLAYAAFRSDKYNLAANYFGRFLAAQGSKLDEEVRYDVIARMGDSYLTVRDYAKANQYYQQLIDSQAPNQDYALFQQGIIQGLQGNKEAKINTLRSVVEKYPASNYADDVAFEIPYTAFTSGDYETAITGLQEMISAYPRSSYVPRALMTIGLVEYNKGDMDAAKATFQRVLAEHANTDEASQALRSIENIYLDEGDATGYIQYATSVNISELSPAEQDSRTFQIAQNLFARAAYGPAVEAVNAYFDKFPKPHQEKFARYIRGVSLYHTGHPEEALHDLNIILNDWTSKYTENTLLTVAALYLNLKEYNEAIVHLKKLELNSDYKENYTYAVTNLMRCYFELGDFEQVAQYAELIKRSTRSSEEDIAKAHLYLGQAMLQEGNQAGALKELNLAALKSQSDVGAEARYRVAQVQYDNKQYSKAQETAFDVINNLDQSEYWVAKSFILLADTYARKGDAFQAKSTLESIIENYEGKDDVIPEAKKRLQKLKK